MGATDVDPFAIFHAAPVGETSTEKAQRLKQEAEAQRISDMIDEQLKAEKQAMKKEKYTVRVLLLGQSESGKSTTLKNFRMRYARAAWEEERASWRAVIQLNLIRSIITIVEAIQDEMEDASENPPSPSTRYGNHSTSSDSPTGSSFNFSLPSDAVSQSGFSSILTERHQLLKLRLGPLRRVQTDLKRRLGEGAEEEQDGVAAEIGPLDNSKGHRPQRREFTVRRLHDALQKGASVHKPISRNFNGGAGSHSNGSHTGSDEDVTVDDATEIIASCREDMRSLWCDESVRAVLKKRKIRLEDSAGFFLDDLDRIAHRNYEPSDDDVLRARLRTLGVQEYKINFEPNNTTVFSAGIGGDVGKTWLLYDVGGSRTVRHAWIPFFEDVQAIIFLAPVSCFDERLSEDSKVNRLEDSFMLWRSVTSSALLSKATMILFLNKCDLLKKKLRSGVMVRQYLPSFGDRPNDTNTVVKYLREKFKEILKQQSPEQRAGYFYATSVIDTKATSTTIKAVKDSILRHYLVNAEFL
ncbi:G-protein alpha subunit [Panaeolus papilionaceus]|nr:G-protein alpha subunit [Panaeolus papilionaceus]